MFNEKTDKVTRNLKFQKKKENKHFILSGPVEARKMKRDSFKSCTK